MPAEISDPALLMTLQIQPVHPQQLDPTQFQIRLSDRYGKPVQGAAITADLEMPSMEMGTNQVALKPVAPGVYTGIGRFTMAGSWEVHLTAGTKTQTATKTFPIEVQ